MNINNSTCKPDFNIRSIHSTLPNTNSLSVVSFLTLARLFQGAEDAVGREHPRGAAGFPPTIRQPLRVRGPVRLRAQLQHLLPQQEGPAAALAAVSERWACWQTHEREGGEEGHKCQILKGMNGGAILTYWFFRREIYVTYHFKF